MFYNKKHSYNGKLVISNLYAILFCNFPSRSINSKRYYKFHLYIKHKYVACVFFCVNITSSSGIAFSRLLGVGLPCPKVLH